MEQLNNLDVVFLIIVGISALVGIVRGMTKEVLSIFGWVLAAAALYFLVPIVDPIMQQYVASKILSNIVSGMVILIVFCIVWLLTADRLAAIVRSSKLSALDRIFGFLFGMVRGALIVILIAVMITTLIPEQSKEGVFAKSQYFKLANDTAEPLKAMIPNEWVDGVKAKMSEYTVFKKDDTKPADQAEKETVAKETTDETAQVEAKEQTGLEDQLRQAADAIENLKMLQKNGEELFNELAQPQAVSPETQGVVDDLSSDLDDLLDVLEDRVVTPDEQTPELKSDSQKVIENVKEKISE
jgi:membrane protein required for colicin V production